MMNKVPELTKKQRPVDPDSLAAALNWDKIAKPDNTQPEGEKATDPKATGEE